MESVLTSCPFWWTAFLLIESFIFSLPTAWISSFWGDGGGPSIPRKSSGLSLRVSTEGGVFSAIGLKGVDCVRSGLENGMFIISCYNSLWNLHNHTSIWKSFLESLFQVSICWCYRSFFQDPHLLTFGVFHFLLNSTNFCHLSSSGRRKCCPTH